MEPLLTPYGQRLNRRRPLPEYPRPQLERASYLNLNGPWHCAFTKGEKPGQWPLEITVPFAPESLLSGVQRTLQPGETLWYKRGVTLPEGFLRQRLLLHFGAVDERCRVWVNGQEAGAHEGGFLPFELDVTDLWQPEENELLVAVQDDTETAGRERGSQSLQSGGSTHSAVSGIWQTVWMESVPEAYVHSLRITPLYDESKVSFLIHSDEPLTGAIEIYAGRTLSASGAFVSEEPAVIELPGALSWRPELPFLYTVKITAGEDVLTSYFGMRKFGMGPDEQGVMRFELNNKPLFHAGVLDLGIYPDGLYTPAADRTMIDDLRYAKKCGFNAVRKSGKLEPLRWYYHCDKLGLLVWQDLPAGGEVPKSGFFDFLRTPKRDAPDNNYKRSGRQDAESRRRFVAQLDGAAALLYNCVSLAVWVLFDEGHGQFDAEKLSGRMRKLDAHRLVDHASGWFDQGAGDVFSLHFVSEDPVLPAADENRAAAASFMGGFGLVLENHQCADAPEAPRMLRDKAAYESALADLYALLPAQKRQGLAAAIYAMLADVEDEVFGLRSCDRRQDKIDANEMARLMEPLK